MPAILTILILGLLAALIVFIYRTRELTRLVAQQQAGIATAKQQCEAEIVRIRDEAAQAVNEAQKLIDQQVAEIGAETDRIRQHYEDEARKAMDASREQLAKALRDSEQLKKYASLLNAEEEVRRVLADAMTEATALRSQAQALLEQAHAAAESERLRATERARAIYEQADARLNQATRDAGRIVADAEKRAKEIAGEAHDALRDKQLLEHAAEAMRNIIEGYGDRYIIPTHSLLDDLAVEFGYGASPHPLDSFKGSIS